MVDWIAHLLVPWIGSKIFQLKSSKLSNREIPIIMFGAVIPDIIKINYLLSWIEIDVAGFLLPFHTPVGSAIVAAIISLMFARRRVFFLMIVGVIAHFALDALLTHVAGGMIILFPFDWTWGFQLGLIPSDSWTPTVLSVVTAGILFLAAKSKARDKPSG